MNEKKELRRLTDASGGHATHINILYRKCEEERERRRTSAGVCSCLILVSSKRNLSVPGKKKTVRRTPDRFFYKWKREGKPGSLPKPFYFGDQTNHPSANDSRVAQREGKKKV